MQRSQGARPKMRNGNSPMSNGIVNGLSDMNLQESDIRQHMSEISRVDGPYRPTVFVPVKGPGREEIERRKNQRRVPTPRNRFLYEDDTSEGSSTNRSFDDVDELAMSASIKSLLGKEQHNGKLIDKRWSNPSKIVPAQDINEKKVKATGEKDNTFRKVVAMRTIVQQRKEVEANDEHSAGKVCENICNFNFVPDSTDPDFFFKKIENQRPDDYFLVEHVGKVTKQTARQILIENIQPEDFIFRRKE